MGKVNYLPHNFPDIPENQKPTAETREILYDLLRTHRYGPFGRSEEPVKTKAKFEALLNHLEDEDGPKVICGTSNNLINEKEPETLPKKVPTAQIRPSNENIKNQERVSALAHRLGVDASSLTSNEKGVRLKIENDGACLFRAILFLYYGNKEYLTCPKKDLLSPKILGVVEESIFFAFNEMKRIGLERPVEYKNLSEEEMATIIWDNFRKNQEFNLYAPSPLIGILPNRSNENAGLALLTDSKFGNISASTLNRMLPSSSAEQAEYIGNFCDIFCGKLSNAFKVSTEPLRFEPYLDLKNHHYNVQYPPDYVTSVTNKDPNNMSDPTFWRQFSYL